MRGQGKRSRSPIVALGGCMAVLLLTINLFARPGEQRPRTVVARAAPPPEARAPAEAPTRRQPTSREGRNLFRPLVAPATPTSPAPEAPPTPPRAAPVVPTEVRPLPSPSPASVPVSYRGTGDLAMVGAVELGGQVKVLLRNLTTGESQYLAVGEQCWGLEVKEIHADRVVLAERDRTYTLGIADKNVPGANPAPRTATGGDLSRFGRDGGGGRFGGGFRRRGGLEPGGDGGGEASNPLASLFQLPTWSERLKRLEEMKDSLEPERYERLHRFFSERARTE